VVARLAQQLQCQGTFSGRGAAAQYQSMRDVCKFEGDVVAALFGNPRSFCGFPHRVVVGEQRLGQDADGISAADKRQQDHPVCVDRAQHGDAASHVVVPVLTAQAASGQPAMEQRHCQW
jgi:hypothetical protein